MIKSFKERETEKVFRGRFSHKLPRISNMIWKPHGKSWRTGSNGRYVRMPLDEIAPRNGHDRANLVCTVDDGLRSDARSARTAEAGGVRPFR